jgi:hypothetical protein
MSTSQRSPLFLGLLRATRREGLYLCGVRRSHAGVAVGEHFAGFGEQVSQQKRHFSAMLSKKFA